MLGGTENNAPLLMFILEDALIAAKLRVELPEQFEEFFETTYPDGTVSSPQKAVAHWLQLSFDVANGKVSMQDPDSDREQQQGAGPADAAEFTFSVPARSPKRNKVSSSAAKSKDDGANNHQDEVEFSQTQMSLEQIFQKQATFAGAGGVAATPQPRLPQNF